jgi:hypothetical protein
MLAGKMRGTMASCTRRIAATLYMERREEDKTGIWYSER